MKHLLLVHTGGTLGMVGGKPHPLRPDTLASTVHSFVPELGEIAAIDFEVFANVDSSELQPEHHENLAKYIFARYESYDGFVIIHGTDTMAYTASALSFLLRGLTKPIVITGSQRPISELRSDAKGNLTAACVLAAEAPAIPEVSIFFGTVLLRGCRATKIWTTHYDAFISPNCPPLANVGVSIERGAHIRRPGDGPTHPGRLGRSLFVVRMFPGLEPDLLRRLLDDGVSGIVIEAFGVGGVPVHERSLIPFLEAAAARNVPVILRTQCLYGPVDPSLYEGGSLAVRAGAIAAGDMTSEAALLKLSVLVGQGANVAQIREELTKDWAGERSPG